MSTLEAVGDDRWQLRTELGVLTGSVRLRYDRPQVRGYLAEFVLDGDGRTVEVALASGVASALEPTGERSADQLAWLEALQMMPPDLRDELYEEMATQAEILAEWLVDESASEPDDSRVDSESLAAQKPAEDAVRPFDQATASELLLLAAALSAPPALRGRAVGLLESGWSGTEEELFAAAETHREKGSLALFEEDSSR